MGISPAMMGNFWRVVREINPASIAREAEQSFCVLICGQPDAGKTTLRGALSSGRWPSDLTLPYLRVVDGVPEDTFGASLCLYVVDASRGLFRDDCQAAAAIVGRGIPLVYVYNKMDLAPEDPSFREAAREMAMDVAKKVAFVQAVDAEQVQGELVPAMLDLVPDLRLALGRRLPLVRDAAALRIVEETSRVNAEFSLFSSLPASLPLLSIGAAGADMAVLTKNQAMMLLKLAAVYGRSLESKPQLFLEIMPVVGAAFLWRTAARTAVSFVPGLVSAAPKAAIAYVGTYLVGRAAQHYYRLGRRPSREALKYYTQEARARAMKALPRVELAPGPKLRALLPPRRPPEKGINGQKGIDGQEA